MIDDAVKHSVALMRFCILNRDECQCVTFVCLLTLRLSESQSSATEWPSIATVFAKLICLQATATATRLKARWSGPRTGVAYSITLPHAPAVHRAPSAHRDRVELKTSIATQTLQPALNAKHKPHAAAAPLQLCAQASAALQPQR